MYLEHKPGETMQVDWAGQTAALVDTDTRILTPDNLKTGVVKNSRTETVLNKSYQEMAEHYSTGIT